MTLLLRRPQLRRPLSSTIATSAADHGRFLLLPTSVPSPPDPVRPPREIQFGAAGGRKRRLLGGEPLHRPSLSLSRPIRPPPHRDLHRSLLQAPSLLSSPLSRSPPFEAPVRPSLSPLLRSLSTAPDDESDEALDSAEEDTTAGETASSSHSKDVDVVCKVVDELFASDGNMEAVLDESGVEITRALVVDVLERFRHAHKPANRFFRWANRRPGFERDAEAYNKMLKVFGTTRQFESMVSLLEEMGKGRLLSLDTFKIAIKAFASAREMKKCLGIFQMMKKYKFDAGLETFNCLVEALARAKLGKEAQALVEKMQDQYSPDLRTYTSLLQGWCNLKNLMEAGRLWNEMLDKGFKPDIVAHNIMLDGLIRGQRRSESIKFFELMKAKGPHPNARTYTILIQDLCKAGKMDLAVQFFKEMLTAGCPPNAVTYTCLIVGFGNAKVMDKVASLLKEMSEKGCPPDGWTYNALIKLMTTRNMPADAARIYKKMIKSGFEPTLHTYNMMMKSYFHGGNYEMGCAVWEEMHRKGICPDVNSYTVFIGGHIRHGRPDEAHKYIDEMLSKGMKAPQIDYNKFASDFSKVGKPDILYELAQKMNFTGKFEASNVFHRWAERMKNRVKRRIPNQIGKRLF